MADEWRVEKRVNAGGGTRYVLQCRGDDGEFFHVEGYDTAKKALRMRDRMREYDKNSEIVHREVVEWPDPDE